MTESTQRYRRLRSIGRGAMGEVWLAEDTVLGREVAVKQLHTVPAIGIDVASVERMVREARTAARLHHRNIVSVFDLVTVDAQPNVVMEYVDGESLAERIHRTGGVADDDVAELGAQVAAALELAHRRGIVHRDVKPANILIERDGGQAKLADFGIARGLGDAALTDTGQLIGTLAFMAPEVARSGTATSASDVWSLGATLFAALEGRPPYDDGSKPNATQLLIKLVTEPVPMSTRSRDLAPLLATMMDPDPAARPSASAVASSLRTLIPIVAALARPPAAGPEVGQIPELSEPKTQVRCATTPTDPRPSALAESTTIRDDTPTTRRADPALRSTRSATSPAVRRFTRRAWLGVATSAAVVAAGVIIGVVSTDTSSNSNPVVTGAHNAATLNASSPGVHTAGPGASTTTTSLVPAVRADPAVHSDPAFDSDDPDILATRYTVAAGFVTITVTLRHALIARQAVGIDFDTDGNARDGANNTGCHSTAIGADYEVEFQGGDNRASLSRLTDCIVEKDGSNSLNFDDVGKVPVGIARTSYTVQLNLKSVRSIARPAMSVFTVAPDAFKDDSPDSPAAAFVPTAGS